MNHKIELVISDNVSYKHLAYIQVKTKTFKLNNTYFMKMIIEAPFTLTTIITKICADCPKGKDDSPHKHR